MTGQDLEAAIDALGMTLTAVADDINRLAGTKLSVNDLSRMKRGDRDPSPIVVLYLAMMLEQRRAEERDPVRSLHKALEGAGLRVVRAGMPPGFMTRPGRADDPDSVG